MSNKPSYLQQRHTLPTKIPIASSLLAILTSRFSIRLAAHRVSMVFAQWGHNRRSRRELAEMPDYLLKDIGLDRCSVEQELHKPFWKD